MPVRNIRRRRAAGVGGPTQDLAQLPIISQRAPLANDFAELGTVWIDVPNDDSYILTSITANTATWINAGGGTGMFQNLNVVNAVTFQAMGTGSLISTAGAISSIDGTDGQVMVAATGALAPQWTTITSDGTVNVIPGANTLELRVTGATASSFPTDVNGPVLPLAGATTIAGGTNIQTDGAVANTVTINLINGPVIGGGFTVTDGTTTITSDTNAADAIYLHANGGAAETIRVHADQGNTAESIHLLSDVGGVTIESVGRANDDSITILSQVGGIFSSAALQYVVTSSEAAGDAILISASDGTGGIDVNCGTGDFDVTSLGGYNLAALAASQVAVSGAGIDLTLRSVAGRVIMNGEEAANNAITLLSAAGGLDANVALQMNLDSSQAAANAIVIEASNPAGGIDINSGTGGIAMDSAQNISLDGVEACNFTTTGAPGEDLTLSNTAGSVIISGGEAAADAVSISAVDVDGGIDINAGTAGVIIDAVDGAISLDSALASNFTVTGAADLTLSSSAGSVNVTSGEADAASIALQSASGGIDVDGALQVNIASSQAAADAIRVNASAGGFDLDAATASSIDVAAGDLSIATATNSINITGAEADAAAVLISASNAAGGITLDAGPTPGVTIDNGTQSAQILVGTGPPDTVVTASQGSIFLNVAGGADTILYVNTDGATAWTALTST